MFKIDLSMRTVPRFLLTNWWVIAFILMAWAFYLQAMHKKNCLVRNLEEKVTELQIARAQSLEEKEEKLFRVQSQDNSEWMELVLKERLGVVPEGQVKVVFQ